MPALIIPGAGGKAALTYVGSIKLEIQAIGSVDISRWGLATGEVKWKVPTSLAVKLSPGIGMAHPVLTYMRMEDLNLAFDKDYTEITGKFVGAYPGAVSTYEYQPNFSDRPILNWSKGGSNFADLVTAAGSGIQQATFTTDNTQFIGFGGKSAAGLAGITSYLVAQGFYVESSVSANAPDCSNDGLISSPDGSPPDGPAGSNWLQAPTFFSQRAEVYDVRRSWKNSGPVPWPAIIY